MKNTAFVEFNTKHELYKYLECFDFDLVKDTKLSDVYFLMEFDNHIEPIHFMRYDKHTWFASPCCLRKWSMENNDVMDYVKEMYEESAWKDAYKHEKNMQINGLHYEICCLQTSPFLPNKNKIIGVFSDKACLHWLLNKENNTPNEIKKNNTSNEVFKNLSSLL